MTHAAIAMVLLSALLHAVWNFFNKGSPDRWGFFFGQGVATILVYAPLFVWYWPQANADARGWLWVAVSAVTHAGYAFYLLKAYDAGDLSVAYPLSRTAPVLVAAWDMLTVRGQLSAAGVCGALLAGIGAVVLQIPALRARGSRAVLGEHVTRYALMTAVFIALFTIVDKQGVMHMQPFIYLYLILAGELGLVWMRLGRSAVPRARREMLTNTRALLFTALLGPSSYLMILWVLKSAPASYVLGLRQTSIVFGVLLGRFVLGEGEMRYRLLGAGVIAGGSLLIATAG